MKVILLIEIWKYLESSAIVKVTHFLINKIMMTNYKTDISTTISSLEKLFFQNIALKLFYWEVFNPL